MRRRLALFCSLAAGLAFGAHPAAALPELYTIDPTQSFFAIAAGSGASLDFGAGPIDLPFTSQVGEVAGVSGLVLPGVGLSDGLRTNLTGQIQADYRPGIDIRFYSNATFVLPVDSGTWAPGEGATPPALAQAGVVFEGAYGIRGTAALRDAGFTFANFIAAPVTPLGGDAFSFFGALTTSVLGGVFDFDTNLAGVEGRGYLEETFPVLALTTGRIDDLGGGLRRITLPIDLILEASAFDIGGGLPVGVSLRIQGQVVAVNGVIPEPGTALLLGAGLLGIATRARRGGRFDA